MQRQISLKLSGLLNTNIINKKKTYIYIHTYIHKLLVFLLLLLLLLLFKKAHGSVHRDSVLIKIEPRCNSMQLFIYCKVTLHVLGVTAPIIRSTKNCNRNLRYRSYCKIQGLTGMN